MNKSDLKRNYFMLKGPLAKKGYDWWWHSLTAYNKKTGEPRPFLLNISYVIQHWLKRNLL